MNKVFIKGETYTATVNRILSNGNAMINTESGHINLRGGTENMVGKTVASEFRGGHTGERVSVNQNPIADSGWNKTICLMGIFNFWWIHCVLNRDLRYSVRREIATITSLSSISIIANDQHKQTETHPYLYLCLIHSA